MKEQFSYFLLVLGENMQTNFLIKCKANWDRRKSSPKGDYLIRTILQNKGGHFSPKAEDLLVLFAIIWIKFRVCMLVRSVCFIISLQDLLCPGGFRIEVAHWCMMHNSPISPLMDGVWCWVKESLCQTIDSEYFLLNISTTDCWYTRRSGGLSRKSCHMETADLRTILLSKSTQSSLWNDRVMRHVEEQRSVVGSEMCCKRGPAKSRVLGTFCLSVAIVVTHIHKVTKTAWNSIHTRCV